MASTSPSRSPQLRKDSVTNRWVIFSPARAKRPSDFKSKSPANPNPNHECPFCIGHEHECAPEIFRVPPQGPDWKVRVIQNLYPALSREVPDDRATVRNPRDDDDDDPSSGPGPGPGRVLDGIGFHDVVIESPVHSIQLCDLSPLEIGEVVRAYRRRILQIASYKSIKYVQLCDDRACSQVIEIVSWPNEIVSWPHELYNCTSEYGLFAGLKVFKNHGASAGASMSHSHSQMLALPIVPPNVSARIESMKEYFGQTEKCAICEVRREDLLIDASTHFISVVPFAATFPFEIWIIPRDHAPHFHEIDDEKAVDLGRLLKLMLRKLSLQLNDPPFNFMIQTSPLHIDGSDLSHSHWFLQIVTQLTVVAGFETGSGCYINPVFPEDAAKVLREVNVPM